MANNIAKIWLPPFIIIISLCTLQRLASTSLVPLISNESKCPWIKDDPNNWNTLVISCTLQASQVLPHGSVTCPEEDKEALIVLGDYGESHIKCSAGFPIQFNFDGITPTEALHVEYSNARTEEGQKVYSIHVRIQSIRTIWSDFLRENPKFGAPPGGLNYSRTGNYTFQGLESHFRGVKKTFYIFFEEPEAKPEFIRNEQMGVSFAPSNDLAYVPCRPTHYNSSVQLQPPTLLRPSKVKSLTASHHSGTTSYTCTLKYGQFTDKLTWDVNTKAGQQDIGQGRKLIMLKFSNSKAAEDDAIANCTNHDGLGGRLSLAIQPVSTQYDYERLHKCVLPKYRSRSHLVITKVAENSDQSGIILTNLTRGTAGIIFCSNEKYYDVTGFSVDFKGQVNVFPYEGVGSNLKLFKARIVEDPGRALRISSSEDNESSLLFGGDNVTFSCHFDAFYLCSPPIWVQEYTNGTEFVLENKYVVESLGVSNATVKLHLELSQVRCNSSLCGSLHDIVSVSKTVTVKPRPTSPPPRSPLSTALPSVAAPFAVSLYTLAPVDYRSTGSASKAPDADSTEPSVQESKGPSPVNGSVAAFVVLPILLLIISAAVYLHVRRKETSASHVGPNCQNEPWILRWQRSFRRILS